MFLIPGCPFLFLDLFCLYRMTLIPECLFLFLVSVSWFILLL